jgi:hypothetical protein
VITMQSKIPVVVGWTAKKDVGDGRRISFASIRSSEPSDHCVRTKGGGGVDVLSARLLGERSRKGNFNGLVVRGSFVHVQRRGDIITLVLD